MQETVEQEIQQPVAASYNREEVITACKESVNFLAGFCAPEIFKYLLPPTFLAIWNLLVRSAHQTRGVLRLAIGLPRGFAKTFFLKIFCIYLILFTDRRFILIVCNTEPLAMNFLNDIFSILSSPNIRAVFGDYRLGLKKDTQSLKNFGFRGRDIIVAGVGSETSIRGLNLEMRRPDAIIMDDMQKREDAENPLVANKQLIWMIGTLIKARDYSRCLIVFVGNLYPFEGSILKKLKYNRNWVSFIAGGILADGTSLWEEMRPLKELLEELDNDIQMGHPEIFYAEVLNDEEAGASNGFDVSKIPSYPVHLDTIEPQGGFIVIDPATGKLNSNVVAIGMFFLYDGKPVLRKLKCDRYSPGKTIQKALTLALRHNIRCICVESNAYQYTFLYWFDFICKQLEIRGIELCELYAPAFAKNAKIKQMLPQLLSGDIMLHPDVRSAVVTQIIHWNPLKQQNIDDILDLLSYCYKSIEQHGHFMELAGSPQGFYGEALPPAATDAEIHAQLTF